MKTTTTFTGYIDICSKGYDLFPLQLALKDNKTDKIILLIMIDREQYAALKRQANDIIHGLQAEITQANEITFLK